MGSASGSWWGAGLSATGRAPHRGGKRGLWQDSTSASKALWLVLATCVHIALVLEPGCLGLNC